MSVYENATRGTILGRVTAFTDDDELNETIRYSITNETLFSVNIYDGTIFLKEAIHCDDRNNIKFEIVASFSENNNSFTDTALIYIRILRDLKVKPAFANYLVTYKVYLSISLF